MNRLTTKKNKRGKHEHKQQIIISKYIAMPVFPGIRAGQKLPVGTFNVAEFHSAKEYPTKESWEKAAQKAEKLCQTFIDSQPAGSYSMFRKGNRTSYRYMIQNITKRKEHKDHLEME